jgi:hypothetical protein
MMWECVEFEAKREGGWSSRTITHGTSAARAPRAPWHTHELMSSSSHPHVLYPPIHIHIQALSRAWQQTTPPHVGA